MPNGPSAARPVKCPPLSIKDKTSFNRNLTFCANCSWCDKKARVGKSGGSPHGGQSVLMFIKAGRVVLAPANIDISANWCKSDFYVVSTCGRRASLLAGAAGTFFNAYNHTLKSVSQCWEAAPKNFSKFHNSHPTNCDQVAKTVQRQSSKR